MSKIDDRLDTFVEGWRPNPGDKLTGTVTDVDQGYSEYHEKPYPIVTVLTEDGKEVAFHGFHTVAKSELAKQRPQIGESIGIAYHGKHEKKGYERYRIIVEREAEAPAPDWDRIAEDAQVEKRETATEQPSEKQSETPPFEEPDKPEQKSDDDIPF